jgi:hypothetical protein
MWWGCGPARGDRSPAGHFYCDGLLDPCSSYGSRVSEALWGTPPPTCSPSAESAGITTSLQSATFGCPNSRVSEHKILYLFCDGIYLRLRPELRAHPAVTTVQAA